MNLDEFAAHAPEKYVPACLSCSEKLVEHFGREELNAPEPYPGEMQACSVCKNVLLMQGDAATRIKAVFASTYRMQSQPKPPTYQVMLDVDIEKGLDSDMRIVIHHKEADMIIGSSVSSDQVRDIIATHGHDQGKLAAAFSLVVAEGVNRALENIGRLWEAR